MLSKNDGFGDAEKKKCLIKRRIRRTEAEKGNRVNGMMDGRWPRRKADQGYVYHVE